MNRSTRLALALTLVAGPAAWAQVARPAGPAAPAARDALVVEPVAGEKPAAPAPVAEKPAAAEPAAEPAKQAEEADKNLPDERFLQSQRTQRDNARNMNTSAVAGGEAELSDLIQLKMDGDFLGLETGANSGVRSQRFRLKGADAFITITQSTSTPMMLGGVVRPSSTSLSASRIDTDVREDDAIWSSSVTRSNTYLSMSGQSVLRRISFSQRTTTQAAVAIRATPPVRLTVYEWQAGPRQRSIFSATSQSIQELRSQHPDEFRKYLVPLFHKFSDMSWMVPGATDVYGVFPEIRPDDDVVARLHALLPELDSAGFDIREAAAGQLMELGPAGVLAALRMDPESLTNEQKGQLGRLIAAHRRRDIANPLDARKDAAFLTDCLEHPDPGVREAALLSLEKVLEKDLEFDSRLAGEALTAAADAIRRQVRELIPATQPADADAANPPQPPPAPIQRRLLIP